MIGSNESCQCLNLIPISPSHRICIFADSTAKIIIHYQYLKNIREKGGSFVAKLQSDHHQNEVTSVICRNIKPGHESDYDNWVRRYLTFERKAPGYLGTTIIVPGGSKSSLRYIIRRFADRAAMEAWDDSEESQKLLQEANNYSSRLYETSTGLETWFTLPGLKTLSQSPPPRWKMAIVIFFAAYAISSLSRSILNPFLDHWPILGNAVIYTAILVLSLTYFALPILNRLLRRWLYPGSL